MIKTAQTDVIPRRFIIIISQLITNTIREFLPDSQRKKNNKSNYYVFVHSRDGIH